MLNNLPSRITRITVIFFAMLLVLWTKGQIFAQEVTGDGLTASTITAIPPRLGDDGSLRGNPGDVIQAEIKVRNATDQPMQISSTVEDFLIASDGITPQPVLETTNVRWSMAKWISLAGGTNRIVAPRTTTTIPIVVSVPRNALPGGKYAMILHQPIGSSGPLLLTNDLAAAAGTNQRVGTLIYFRVNGPVKEEALIRNLEVPMVTEYGPVPLSFDVENLSDIHIKPELTVKIRNWIGQVVNEEKIESANVFPLSLRHFATKWDRVWGFGRYTLEVTMVYGEQAQVSRTNQHFWLFPYTLVLGIIVLLLALFAIGLSIRRHWLHRNRVEQQHIELLEERIRQLEDQLDS